MLKEQLKNVLSIQKHIIENNIYKDNIVIDATVGNGNDTLFVKKLLNDTGKIYCFDIQNQALKNTKYRILKEGFNLTNIYLINDSHENLDIYVKEEVDLVIFNLGYLPGGNHSIVTKPESSILAISKALKLIKKTGKIIIVGYIGHEGGYEEVMQIHKYLTNIDQKKFNIIKIEFINQINSPPVLYCIERKL